MAYPKVLPESQVLGYAEQAQLQSHTAGLQILAPPLWLCDPSLTNAPLKALIFSVNGIRKPTSQSHEKY